MLTVKGLILNRMYVLLNNFFGNLLVLKYHKSGASVLISAMSAVDNHSFDNSKFTKILKQIFLLNAPIQTSNKHFLFLELFRLLLSLFVIKDGFTLEPLRSDAMILLQSLFGTFLRFESDESKASGHLVLFQNLYLLDVSKLAHIRF